MMDEMMSRFREIVSDSDHLVAFTGAGISSESGIPTYRGSGGLWTKYDPDKYANIYYFRKEPEYYWSFFKDVRYPVLKNAIPNAAHTALVELERRGNLKALITQNIDDLHRMAGQSKVIELHGNTRKISCMECGKTITIDEAYERLKTELPPRCDCGGVLKPDVVFFGEQLPQYALIEAQLAAESCDTFLVVGSSLVVHPAAQLPAVAKQHGASLIILNIDPTPFDGLADVVINERAAEVLPGLVREVEG